ncbi:hypothetical protein C0993_005361 [Termitomyces sp. T159_Od127]|nr:hypothetical protein C0993_005361 [Termitomyces sp. T159_Od127]
MPLHSQIEVDEEDGCYEHQFADVHHKHYYQPVSSLWQALVTTYACAVAPAVMREVVPQAQYKMGMEVLLQCLETAGQPVPSIVLFLQDNLAVIVMEGLLDQIKLMQKQHVSALEQISEPKQARQQLPWPANVVRAGVPTTSWSVPQVAPSLDRPGQSTTTSMCSVLLAVMSVLPMATSTGQAMLLPMLAQPAAAFARQLTFSTLASVVLTAPKVLEVQRAMNEEMVPVDIGSAAPPSKGTVGLPRHGPSAMSQALNALEPFKTHQRQKPPLAASQLEIVDFPANIPEQAEAAQMLFMKAMVFLALPEQVVVVVMPTDPCTPAQYDGIVATMAAKKGKHCEAPPADNDSNYRESQSKEEEEEEEGKTPTQHF